MRLTPEQRTTLKRRSLELKGRMAEILSVTGVPVHKEEWVALYKEREAIAQQLGDDDAEPEVLVAEFDPSG